MPKPRKNVYDRNGNKTADYSTNKDGDMNQWGIKKIKEEGPAPSSKVPKEDKTHL